LPGIWAYSFWFAWYAFHPKTEVFGLAEGQSRQMIDRRMTKLIAWRFTENQENKEKPS